MRGFLSTRGNQIVDDSGRSVKITGVNWSGFETPRASLDGLHFRDYRDMINQMADQGFNTIRIPISTAMLNPGRMPQPGSIDTWNTNRDLAGLTSLEVLDRIILHAGSIGMRVILDHHRSSDGYSSQESGLWYTPLYPEERWISDWVMLAKRYVNDPTVIGADLHNEPFGQAGWGTGLPTDWAAAAERAGAAIQSVNPDWLIFVEGVQTYDSQSYWWGGNLMGVRDRPIQLPVANKLVYSAHEYPNSVYPQAWFYAPNFPNNLPQIFDQYWGYIYREGIAPVYLGEFGSRLTDHLDLAWMEKLGSYLSGDFDADGDIDIPTGAEGISWTWWGWGPNSGDTGGLLNPDWVTLDRSKLEKLSPLLWGQLFPVVDIGRGTDASERVDGSWRPDHMRGFGGDDTLSGGANNDTMDGGTGNDRMAGNLGDDIYLVDSALDVVQELVGEGIDTVRTSIGYRLPSNVEHLETTNPNGFSPLALTGNAESNTIVGNAGSNTIDGGASADQMIGRGGNDIYLVDDSFDLIVENAGEGNDTVRTSVSFALGTGLENLETRNAGDLSPVHLVGNEQANVITGNAGRNMLDGGGGDDNLQGLGGNDTYFVDRSGDRIFEAPRGGVDRVYTSVSYNIGSRTEIEALSALIPAARGSLTLIGSDTANKIYGSAGANTIKGQRGNDTIFGYGGNDRLYGGAGKDLFVFNTKPHKWKNVDKILDFRVVDDTIAIDNAVFTKIGKNGRLKSSAFYAGKAAHDRSDRVIYDKATGSLYYDADGTGSVAQIKFAILAKKLALSTADFKLI